MKNSFVFCDETAVNGICEWAKQERGIDTNWYLFDEILYEMCRRYPDHTNAHEIVAKMAIIGRSYSAAVERRKNTYMTNDRDFYYGYVAPLILDSELDDRLNALREFKTPTEDNLHMILSAHLYLQELLEKCTDLKKRSLASKYLHFHCPNLFYIYDSYSERCLNSIVKAKTKWKCPDDADHSYALYCEKSLFVQSMIAPGEENFPRILDSYLQYQSRV